MFVRTVLVVFLVSISAARSQTAPAPGPTLQQALIRARYPVVLRDSELSGTGAILLNNAIHPSRFVMLGEDHFTREIPRFAEALCDIMHPDAYAVEAGPYAARFVNSLLSNPNRLKIMAERSRAFPNNMAFLDAREENDLAAHCAASSRNPDFAVWGLDQEFLGSASTLLAAMAASNPGPVALAAITAAQLKDHAAEAEARRTGDFNKLLLQTVTNDDMQALQKAMHVDGNKESQDLLREFTISHTIYRLNDDGSAADSGLLRAELLKQHFLEDYTPFKQRVPTPRILFKLGDNHTAKGFNYTHELNLGNFIAEVAAGEQAQSLHILVLGARGRHYTIDKYDRPLGQRSFLLSDDPDYRWTALAIANILPQQPGTSGTTLTLFDLRQLRSRALDLPGGWEHIIYSYDIFILMPEVTVASLIE
jgi:hypothetical protein